MNPPVTAIDVALLRAEQCLESRDLEGARRAYEYVIQQAPHCLEAVEGLADLLLHDLAELQAADEMYQRAIALAPNEGPEKYFNYAELLSQTDPLKAEEVYLRGTQVAQFPGDAKGVGEAFVALAELFLDQRSEEDEAPAKCRHYLTQAREAYGTAGCHSAELERVSALFLYRAGDVEAATAHALRSAVYLDETAEEDQPTLAARLGLVRLLMQVGELATAWRLALDLHTGDGTDAETFDVLAEIRMRDDDPAHAMDILRYAETQLAGLGNPDGVEQLGESIAEVRTALQERGIAYDYERPLDYDPLCLPGSGEEEETA